MWATIPGKLRDGRNYDRYLYFVQVKGNIYKLDLEIEKIGFLAGHRTSGSSRLSNLQQDVQYVIDNYLKNNSLRKNIIKKYFSNIQISKKLLENWEEY